MKNYKLFMCDLDGTLLNGELGISKENSEAIEKLSELGMEFVPCTGRCYGEIPSAVKECDKIKYFICSNGASVYERVGGELRVIKDLVFRRSDLNYLIGTVKKYTTMGIYHVDGNAYTDNHEFSVAKRYNTSDFFMNHIEKYTEKLDDLYAFLKDKTTVEMATVLFGHESELAQFKEDIEKNTSLCVTTSNPSTLEVTPNGATKGEGIITLASHLGIPVIETIAAGDSPNDISMLKTAGLGVAVKNASASAKEASDDVGCSAGEGIVKYVLEKFIL